MKSEEEKRKMIGNGVSGMLHYADRTLQIVKRSKRWEETRHVAFPLGAYIFCFLFAIFLLLVFSLQSVCVSDV